MAHTRFFKDKIKSKLRSVLKKYGIVSINSDYETTILNYASIFWDFRIHLQHDLILLFEVETKRQDPVNNLIKTLIWLNEQCPNGHLVLFHFFDASYSSTYTPSKDICSLLWSFVSRDYRKNLIYTAHPIDELTKVAQSKRKTKSLSSVSGRICEIAQRVVHRKIKDIYSAKRRD